ncbi:hypothetical protein [Prevotella sp.]
MWLEYLMLESLLGLFLSAAKVIKDIKTAKELKEKRQIRLNFSRKRQSKALKDIVTGEQIDLVIDK